MSYQTPNHEFWRSKYARQCIRNFQAQQKNAYILLPPGGGPLGSGPHVPPDRPPLTPIHSPAPIFTRPGGAPQDSPTPSDLLVCIVGAGVAGLYTALILEDLGIKYEILEGSSRPGGRVYTHHFQSPSIKPWSYFDIGAMRFPDIPAMWRVFDLFRNRLRIEDKLVPYIMSHDNQFLEYNSNVTQLKKINTSPTADWFKDSTSAGGRVPPEYLSKGVDYYLGECFSPFKDLLAKDWKKGWEKLMEFDKYSARTFMMLPFDIKNNDGTYFLKKDGYPHSVINWLERMSTGTGLFDMAFTEMVLDDLQFDWPSGFATKFGGDGAPELDGSWYCLAGGSEIFIEAMIHRVSDPSRIKYNKRVISISPIAKRDRPMSVTYNGAGARRQTEYDYVVSTVPLPALRFVDLNGCNLSYAQLEGMRTLRYDSSCKVGLRFSTRWWEALSTGAIKGGQSKSDRIFRTAVFPSYGVDDPNADAVMIASYTWSQDAARVAGLIQGRNTVDEQFLVDHILMDLSVIHGVPIGWLKNELQDWCAWDWYSDPFTLGAFALFGPSQFSDIYPSFGQGAAGGRLLFAGEAMSEQHAWVEGALDSAYEAVWKILEGEGLQTQLRKLEANWGNPHLSEADAKEYRHLLQQQEFLGTLFSTTSDRDGIKHALGL